MLLGNPKKAILTMVVPIAVAMMVETANNLIDAFWVVGLGSDAMAAVGLIFPLFFIMISVGNGIGIGASFAVSKNIGSGDKTSADRTAAQAIMLTVIGSMLISVFLFLTQRQLLESMGAGDTIGLCLDYVMPLVLFSPFILLNVVITNLLRSEGAAKKAMITQIFAAVINMILDPFFIYDYGLGLGIAGAAWATIIAMLCSLLLLLYWFLIKRNTYLDIRLKGFRFERKSDADILRVGIPASSGMLFMSVASMMMNAIIIMTGGIDGVAVYSSTWRLLQMLMIPMMAVGLAIVPVCAAAYGAKRYDKVKTAYYYSLKISVLVMIVIAVLTALFADYLVMIFTYSESTIPLRDEMVSCLRLFCIFLPFTSLGFVSSGFFESLGMGVKSLISMVIWSGLQVPTCYILAIMVGTLTSVWYGIVITEIIGPVIMVIWGLMVMYALMSRRTEVRSAEG
ncbi:MAG: MATE family efflux transporter [Candidatus Methanomethylophilaceae archaeon]